MNKDIFIRYFKNLKKKTTQSPYVTRRGSLCPVPAVCILPWGRARGGGGVPVQTLRGPCTCSLMVLIPSGPRRDTACFTRSVRPQFSIRKPRSCLNLASMATASSFREAQKQSSALRKGEMVRCVQQLRQDWLSS